MKSDEIKHLIERVLEDCDGSVLSVLHVGPKTQEALRNIPRLIAWIERTAEKTAVDGYHARRIRLEAKAILEGKEVP